MITSSAENIIGSLTPLTLLLPNSPVGGKDAIMQEKTKLRIIITTILVVILFSIFGMNQAKMAKSVSRIVFEAAHKHNWFWSDGWFILLMNLSQQSTDNKIETDLTLLTKSFKSSMAMTSCFSSIGNIDGNDDEKRIIQDFVRIFDISERKGKDIVWIAKTYSSIFSELPLMMDCTTHGTMYSMETIKLLSDRRWYKNHEKFHQLYQNMKDKEKLYSDLSYSISIKADKLYFLFFCFFCFSTGLLFFVVVLQNHKNAQKQLKMSNKVLQENKETLQLAQSIAQVGSWEWDIAKDVFVFSDEMCRIFEITDCHSAINMWQIMEQMIHPDDQEYIFAQTKDAWLNKTFKKVTTRVSGKDGKISWIDIMPPDVKETTSDGRPLFMIGTVQDITERMQSEEEIKQLSLFRESIIDNADIWLNVLDINSNVILWNKAAEKISGFSKEEVMGHSMIWEWCYPDEEYRNEITARAASTIQENKIIEDFETTIVSKGGKKRSILWNSRNLVNHKGKTIGSIALGQDITSQKQAQEALRENEKLLRTMAENYPNSYIAIIEKDYTIGFTSGREFKRQNLDPEQYTGLPLEQVFHDNTDAVRTQYKKAFNGTECAFEMSINNEHQYYRAVPLFAEDGSIPRILVVAENITDRKELESRLQQAQKMDAIGTLAGGIAHDFNNLLGVITGNVSYSLSQLNQDDELFEVLMAVQEGASQAKALTHQLLTFSKGGEPVKKTLNINPLLKESAQFANRGSNTRCEFELCKKIFSVDVDPGQINQVINNLVINANQAMPHGGIIYIRSENVKIEPDASPLLSAGNYVKIIVEDQGIGISKKHLSSIFDPFFTTKQKGNGLGLSSAYSIIQKHNSHITVSSELEAGTVFNIYIPASDNAFENTKNKQDAAHKGHGKVLLLDDQEQILKMMGRMLNRMGYEAEFTTDGTQTVEIYKEAQSSGMPFDLVILDLTVPGGMGGAKTIIELLKINPSVKAIVSSGYSNDPIMANYEDYGFCAIASKPYSFAQLNELLNKILDPET